MLDAWWSILERGGPVMWPLLGLSVVSLTLSLERVWFFASVSRLRNWQAARGYAAAIRTGETRHLKPHAKDAGELYGPFLADIHASVGGGSAGDDTMAEAIETHRGRVERFLPWLSMIITAAPMLGVLGTVLGIIESFELIGSQSAALGPGGMDPRDVGAGIAEALISTAAGLVVALLTLVPYVALRGRAEATLGKLEVLAMSVPSEADAATEGGAS